MRFNTGRVTDDTPGTVGFPHSPDWDFARLDAIVSDAVPVDPWSRRGSGQPFHLDARELLQRAAKSRPAHHCQTVTDFTSWIYSLHVSEADSRKLHGVKLAEDLISDIKRLAASARAFQSLPDAKWKLLHSGLGNPSFGSAAQESFEIPSLTFAGRPLRGCPDLVFENVEDGHIALIEVKFSMRIIPSNLWPNVWAQLWAYSLIPQFAIAPRITAVGEIWGDNSGSWRRPGLDSLIYLRSTVKRDPRAPAFHRFFRTLFELYGGSVAG